MWMCVQVYLLIQMLFYREMGTEVFIFPFQTHQPTEAEVPSARSYRKLQTLRHGPEQMLTSMICPTFLVKNWASLLMLELGSEV